jgi:hypothetical protein
MVQYGRVISNEHAALPKYWTPEQLSRWLRQPTVQLDKLRAFDGMDGKAFIKFFDRSTDEELVAALRDNPGFVRAQLRCVP